MSATVTGMDGTAQRLEGDARRGEFCSGTQIYVSYRGETVLDAAFGHDGLGRPMGTDTLSAVYCTIKPMISVLVLLAEQDGALRREMVLGELLEIDGNPALAEVRLEDLLTHRAGLHTIPSLLGGFTPPAARHELAMTAHPPDGWNRETDAAYSEWLGYYLIAQVLRRRTGVGLPEALRGRLLEPLGIAGEVSLGLGQEDLDRIGVNVDLRDGPPAMPLLAERLPWFAGNEDPSLSGFATMRALGVFYEWVLATLDGRETTPLEPERLREACTPQRPVVFDQIVNLECDWGLGFMTGLRRLGFGPYPSDRAVGHTGQVGTSIAFCDPEHELAVALLYNGVIDQEVGVNERRPAIVGEIYSDLGLAD
jgi:CubicO group peptidase (beta-lactamase class C family)